MTHHTSDDNAVGWVASWPTVEVVLLYIDTIGCSVGDGDVLIGDVGDVAGSLGLYQSQYDVSTSILRFVAGTYVGFDPRTILAVQNLGVLEHDVGHVVVALTADRADRQTMPARAVHVVDGDMVARGDSHAVVLVDDATVGEHNVGVATEVKPIGVVRCGEAAGYGVWSITSGVVQVEVGHGQSTRAGDGKAVCRPVLDMQVVDKRCPKGFADDEEVIWLRLAAV